MYLLSVSVCRQRGQCCLGVGHAEDEPGGRARADRSRPMFPVGPQTAPVSDVHRQR